MWLVTELGLVTGILLVTDNGLVTQTVAEMLAFTDPIWTETHFTQFTLGRTLVTTCS